MTDNLSPQGNKILTILRKYVKEFETGWSEYSVRNVILNSLVSEDEPKPCELGCFRDGVNRRFIHNPKAWENENNQMFIRCPNCTPQEES